MDPKEVIKKVKRIEIKTNRALNDVFAGEYKSVFKGRGMEFSEVREYIIGDQIRDIDWNVTARNGKPFVKVFREERELTIMLLVDLSSSGEFGTTNRFKGELAAEISALLAFSAIKNNDRVGLIIFTDKIEKFIPPKKGKSHVLRLIRDLLSFTPEAKATDINMALEYFYRIQKKRSIAFLISDFMGKGFESAVKMVNKKHDLIAVGIGDQREAIMPAIGLIEFEDSETQERIIIDTEAIGYINSFKENYKKEKDELVKLFKSIDVDYLDIMTDQDYVREFMKLFSRREKRFSR